MVIIRHNEKNIAISIIAALIMVSSVLVIPYSDGDDATSSPIWSYTIIIGADEYNTVVISSVTDIDGNDTTNLTKESVGSWGWDENFEYGPFGSYYAVFDNYGRMTGHVRADDLRTLVGYEKGTNNNSFSSYSNIMWVLPTVYWKSTDTTLTLTNDPNAGGTAYAHTIDGKVYDFLAIGVCETSVPRGGAQSCMDVVPEKNLTKKEFRRHSEKEINTAASTYYGINGYSMQWNYYQWALYKYCVYVTLGSFSQEHFALGLTNENTSNYTPVYFTGRSCTSSSDIIPGYYAGNIKQSSRVFLEDAWGSLYEYVDNTLVYNGELYVGQTSKASDDLTDLSKIGTMPSTDLRYDQLTIQTSAETWGLPKIRGPDDPSYFRSGYRNFGSASDGIDSLSVGSFVGDGYVSSICINDGEYTNHVFGSRLSFVFDKDPVKAKTYDIRYITNNIELEPLDTTVSYGQKIVLPKPIRENWTFDGWYDEFDNKIGDAGTVISVYRDMEFIAHWTDYKATKSESISQPTIDHISENTYSMSIDIVDGQSAIWFDSENRQIGTGATIEHTFEESGNHIGYVRIYNTSDGSLYAEKEWSTENSTEEETKGYEVNIPLAVAATILIAMAGFFLVRRI